MKKIMIALLDWLLLPKVKKWLQGKKTYAVNIAQALGGLAAMLAFSGQFLDAALQSVSLVMGWADPSGPQVGTGSAADSLQQLWAGREAMAAGFSAGLYAMLDAFSKMSTYAASQRRVDKIIEAKK
jgi:hypothetical protein